MSTADQIPLNARSLSYQYNGRRYTLEFDSDYLTCTSTSQPESHTSKTPLWRLLPELLVDKSIPEYSRYRGREARYLLIGAVVAYFSDIRPHVPLLAPALLALGLLCSYRAFRASWPLEKTKVITDYGEEIAVVPHHASIKTRRTTFEQGLLDAIRTARERHNAA
jgi:hypothetical protein